MKAIGYVVTLVLALGLGFFVRGLLPAGPPPGMQGPGAMGPPAVVAQELK